jgi:serine/threonine-protein kinase
VDDGLAEPTPFGKYLLCEKLAEGGMAVVFRAKIVGPSGFEKEFCLKQIRAELAARKEFVDLFVAEAKLTVSLTHANIVPVYELGMVDGTYFLALELIDGPPLAKLIKEGALPPPLAAYVGEQILRGLEYAHRRGVVHRDLTPANVLVSSDGEVKIVDFGIAGPMGRGVRGGSEGYMPPEQAEGGETDARSDLFTVGVLLAEALAGRRGDLAELIRCLPAPLREIVERATAAKPEDRYRDAAAMLAALSRYLRDSGAHPTQSELSSFVRKSHRAARRRAAADKSGPQTAATATGPRTAATGTGPRSTLNNTAQVTFATRIDAAVAPPKGRSALWLAGIAGVALGGVAALSVAIWLRKPVEPEVPTLPDVHLPTIDREPKPTVQLGRLRVTTTPPGAEVRLGDKSLGNSPVDAEIPIAAGKLIIRKRGFDPIERNIELASFSGNPPVAQLVEKLSPVGRGELTVNALPWAHVFIDGKQVGDTPLSKVGLSAGSHQIRLQSPSTGREMRFSVAIETGTELRRVADLRGEPKFID